MIIFFFRSLTVDCFSRLYREAMIPPGRVFRTSDTNSIRTCKGQCMEEGMRCQSFALGISIANGNGTCQLSSERVFENGGRRPRNTIYDPEFNLYQRLDHCYDDNNMPSKPGGNLKKKNVNQILTQIKFIYTFISVSFLCVQTCQ